MTFPECGLCDGMRICSCKSEPIDKRFIAACHAMQEMMRMNDQFMFSKGNEIEVAKWSVKYADALIAELEKK